MSSITKCFGKEISHLNLHEKPFPLHELEPKDDPSLGVLALSQDTPEERLKALFLSKAHSDLKLTLSQSGETIEVHKLILSMTSPIFERMFTNEADSFILDDNPDAIKWILLHAYFGFCDPPSKISDVIILHETLHKYVMNEMAMKCILLLRKSVSVETLDEIFAVSLKFKETILRRRCLEEIQKSGKIILKTASNGKISEDLILSVIESEDLDVPEVDIFKAVVSWAKIKITKDETIDYKYFLKPFLFEIDFLSMQPFQILGQVSEENVFTQDEILGILLASKNISDCELATEDSDQNHLPQHLGLPKSYPTYLRPHRRERRFYHPEVNGRSCQIFMFFKCNNKGKWHPCDLYPIISLQVSEEIYITRIRARPECFLGENFIDIMDLDMVLGSSTFNGPPWDFNPPVEIKRNTPIILTMNGKGKVCHHEFQMFSVNHGNIELCGNSILCDVSIRFIK